MNKIMIEKRDGSYEPLNPEKYHKHLEFALKGFPNLSMSDIEMSARAEIVDKTKSKDIQDVLIRTTANMIYEEPDYDIPAARLLNQDLRKKVYGGYTPIDLASMVERNIENGSYDGEYLEENYTKEELAEIYTFIDYDRDDLFTYGGLKTNVDSYLIKKHSKIMETPQEMYLMINIFAFAKYKDKYDNETRKKWIKIGYDLLSAHKVSLPTPLIKQLRTKFRKFISCVLIHTGDTKYTIANANRSILILVAAGAGIGLNGADIRGLGADIDDGRMKHTGNFQILKGCEKNTKAFTQPDRDGSTTSFYYFFHKEIELFMVLGNAKGTADTRIRDMDHAIVFNDFFFERYANDENITLFYMNDVPDLANYLGDYDEFKKRYEEYERTIPDDKKTVISAKRLLHTFIDERALQAREYAMFADNVTEQGMWRIPIKNSNLCLEITVPSYPIYDVIDIKRNIKFKSEKDENEYYDLRREMYYLTPENDKYKRKLNRMNDLFTFVSNDITAPVDETQPYDYFDLEGNINLSEIGVCILGGINLGHCEVKDLPLASEYLVRLEDELIDYMDYDLSQTEKAAKMRRTIGIGFSDVFHLLAKNKVFYNTKEGRQLLHDRVEICAFYMTKTSIQLAKDFGACILYRDTKYSQGILPIDTYRKSVDELVEHDRLGLPWEELRAELKIWGIRHSTLMANAPFGTSSIPSNSTPGIEPPRGLIAKKSGLPKIVPGYREYGQYYTTVWGDDFNNIDYFKFVAGAQKFMDQAMSLNQYQNLLRYQNNKIKRSLFLEELMTANYYGHKTLYYLNFKTKDKNDNEENEITELPHVVVEEEISGCTGGSCHV